jgi:hypothetical protein
MREVDHAHDAEDERQPGRDEEQQEALLDAVQDLDQEEEEGVHRSLQLSAVSYQPAR